MNHSPGGTPRVEEGTDRDRRLLCRSPWGTRRRSGECGAKPLLFPLNSRLHNHAMATRPKPSLTGGSHTLPFEKLAPLEFERLCLWLVRREGYTREEHLGEAGSEQGRDIVAWKDSRRAAFQCKRV